MTAFPAHAVLGVSTGRVLGDLGGIYSVMSFLIGRSAFTHELGFYGQRASAALRAAIPALPSHDDAEHVNRDNYRACLAQWEKQFGAEIELPDSLRDSLADEKSPVDTASEMVGAENVVVVETK